MATVIGDRVQVAAVFDKELKPVKFKWKGRTVKIKEVTYSWQTLRGKTKLHHFSVTDNESLYELVYDTGTLRWTLGSVE